MSVVERARLEQKLRESPDMLMGIIESATDAIIIIDDAQRVVVFNTAAEKMFGCAADDAIGTHIEDFIPRRFPAEHGLQVRHFIDSGFTNRHAGTLDQLRALRANGEEFPIEASISIFEAQGGKKFLTVVIRDVTDRLRDEDTRYRCAAIVNSSDDAIIGTDLEGTITSWNKGAERLYGYSASEAVGKNISIVAIPDHPDDVRQMHKKVINGEVVQRHETVRQRKDGTRVEISLTASPIVDAEGRVVGASGIARDITLRKLAERELSQTNERLNLIMEAGRIGGWEWDIKSGRNFWFGQKHAQLGARPEPYSESAKGFWDRVHPEDRGWLESAVQEAIRNHTPLTVEFRVVWPDGSVHWLRSQAQFFYGADGQAERMLGMSADITQGKLAEEALRRSEERLRLAARAGRMYTYEWDPATDVIVRSGDVPGVLGPTGEFSLTRRQLLAKVHPDDRALFTACLAERTPEQPDLQITYRLLRPDGSVLWLEKTSHAFFNEQGRIVRMVGMVADITERKQREDAIRESEMRYRRIVETTNEGVWLLDSTLRNSYVNRQMAEMLRYSQEEMVGRSVFDFYFPEDVTRKQEVLNRRQQGVREQIEERLRRRDGSELWVRIAGTPVLKDNGEFDGALAMVTDITEEKRAKEALRQSEERFRLAAQAGKMFAYEWDVSTDVIVRSPEAAQILGIDEAAQITGQQILAKVHPDDREGLAAAVAALRPEKPYLQINYRLARPDGTVIWVERNSRAHFDAQGRMLRVVGMVTDITERKLAEEALRESEERFRLAAQAGKMYAYEWDVATDVFVRSSEYVKILGVTEPQRFSSLGFFNKIHPDDRAKFLATIAELKPENPTREVTYRVVLPDAVVWLKNSGRAFFDKEGRILRVIGMVTDVTDQKRAEEALSDVSRRLIQAQEQERARIARELHDDINQRLAMLAIDLEKAQENHPDLPSEVRSRMHELRKRTDEISTDIQALSHELHSSKLEYLGLVGGMRSWCKEFGERQGLEINFKSHDVPSPPEEISLCLFRVLQEALNNAVKHSGARRIDVELRGDSGKIHLIVSESGKGFNMEEAMQGRGLGLTSMQQRVRLVNGTIVIESKPMKGTTIHVRLPFESGPRAQGAAG
ncbi:MAG TPA: PAS domain S-box protein [Candidatus Cybelea sp.]|nr:PAS domain S-box protein [Candidatus Cybelea sp.]